MRGTLKRGNRAYGFLYTTTIYLVCLITLQAKGISQPGENITFQANNISLVEVFKIIYKQTRLKVSYSNTIFNDKEKVSVNFNNTPIEAVMTFLLKGKDANFEFSENLIIISNKNKDKNNQNLRQPDTLINIISSLIGKVTDTEGKPVPDANVIVKGTKQGTKTAPDGSFSLSEVKINSPLLVSCIGFETREINIRGTSILIKLNLLVSALDETVVIAYGKTSRRYNTGNIGSIKAKDIEKQPVNNPILAMQGRIPGIFIEQSTGLPGSALKVKIQGQNSLSKGSDPLYVIDGVPYSSQLMPLLSGVLGSSGTTDPNTGATTSGNPLSYINPADIESIEVLKDADATSIYGSRAAAGAILITTKKGAVGKARSSVTAQSGWGTVSRKLPLLNLSQYLNMRQEAIKNDNTSILPTDYDINGTWDSTRSTDWQKELIGNTAKYNDIQLSFSGGTPNTQFLLSSGLHKETTVFPGNLGDQKVSLHLNLNTKSNDQRLQLQFDTKFMVDDNKLSSNDLTGFAIKLAPNSPTLYNPDRSLNWAPLPDGTSTWTNPVANLHFGYKNSTKNLLSNAVLKYRLGKWLTIQSNFGYTFMQVNENTTVPSYAILPEYRNFLGGSANFANGSINSWVIEPQVNYVTNFLRGKLEALIGATFLQNTQKRQEFLASGFNSDLNLEDIRSASTVIVTNTTDNLYKYSATFGRINYNLYDKYLLNLSIRRDGSSRFGKENLFHNFGSVAGAWIFSNEQFISTNLSFLSFGKFRTSFGTTGNDQIGDYQYLSLYIPASQYAPYQATTGLRLSALSNPRLQWENTSKLSFGIDLGFWKNRLLFNANYYRNRSSNQLQNYALPMTTGFSSILQNFSAIILNYGWELDLSFVSVKKKEFSITSSLNITIPENKLVSYENLDQSSYAYTYAVGRPISIARGFQLIGVNTETGTYQIADKEGKPILGFPNYITDLTAIINTAPKYYGGLSTNIVYKSISLDFLFQFVKQIGQHYKFGDQPGYLGYLGGNQPTSVLRRWQKPGDITDIAKFSSASYQPDYYNAILSNQAYGNSSYIRLKNVSVSYQIPSQIANKISIENCKLFVQGQNLLTFTNYVGLDPESKSSITLPPLRVITIGLQLSL